MSTSRPLVELPFSCISLSTSALVGAVRARLMHGESFESGQPRCRTFGRVRVVSQQLHHLPYITPYCCAKHGSSCYNNDYPLAWAQTATKQPFRWSLRFRLEGKNSVRHLVIFLFSSRSRGDTCGEDDHLPTVPGQPPRMQALQSFRRIFVDAHVLCV